MGQRHGVGTQRKAAGGNFQPDSVWKVFHILLRQNRKKVGLPCFTAAQADLNAEESGFFNCFSGALISAGTAADTDIGIDDVLVFALGNSLNGALLGAGAALHTSVSNVECHDVTSLWMNYK